MSHTSVSGPKDEEDVGLQSRLREILDKVSLDRSSQRAAEYMAVFSAIGAEGPVGVLTELRGSQERVLSIMREMLLRGKECEKREYSRDKRSYVHCHQG